GLEAHPSSASTSRMLKKPSSLVLASLRGSTYAEVRFTSSLVAAALDGLFWQAAGCSGAITMREITAAYSFKNPVFPQPASEELSHRRKGCH
ncbi:MAG TPA: hypothetical protein VK901_17415, partial [Nitrospiraceae bacterium]|nr:hypothetical protein [Nitrospiraceae bacterium]